MVVPLKTIKNNGFWNPRANKKNILSYLDRLLIYRLTNYLAEL